MEWIKTEDKRPKKTTPSSQYLVMVFMGGRFMRVDIDFYYEGRFTANERGQYTVKYWMPMPELPEGFHYS